MAEIVSARIQGANGGAGYGYFTRRGGRYLGSGARSLTRSEALSTAGQSRMNRTIGTVGARQAARTRRVFR